MPANTSNLPTVKDIARAISEVVMVGELKQQCRRSLAALMEHDKRIVESDTNLRKVGALKKLGVHCITPDVWAGIETTTTLMKKKLSCFLGAESQESSTHGRL